MVQKYERQEREYCKTNKNCKTNVYNLFYRYYSVIYTLLFHYTPHDIEMSF